MDSRQRRPPPISDALRALPPERHQSFTAQLGISPLLLAEGFELLAVDRPLRVTSERTFAVCRRFASYLLVSMCLDAALLAMPAALTAGVMRSFSPAEWFPVSFLLGALATSFSSLTLGGRSRVRDVQRTVRNNPKALMGLLGLLGLVTVAEIVTHGTGLNVGTLVFAGIAVLTFREAFVFVRAASKGRALRVSPETALLPLEQSNVELGVLALIPHLLARIASLSATFGSLGGSVPDGEAAAIWVTAILLMALTMPERSHFIVRCRRCRQDTTRALEEFHVCPRCVNDTAQAAWELCGN